MNDIMSPLSLSLSPFLEMVFSICWKKKKKKKKKKKNIDVLHVTSSKDRFLSFSSFLCPPPPPPPPSHASESLLSPLQHILVLFFFLVFFFCVDACMHMVSKSLFDAMFVGFAFFVFV